MVTSSATVLTTVATLAVITETEVDTVVVVILEVADTRLAVVAITETATIAMKGEDLTRVIEDLPTMTEGAAMMEATIVEPIHLREVGHLLVETTSLLPAATNLLVLAAE